MYELEIASTDDLLNELAKRYEHVVFAGIKMRPNLEHPDNFIRSWRYKGSTEMCQGLAFGLMFHAQQGADNNEEPISSEEL